MALRECLTGLSMSASSQHCCSRNMTGSQSPPTAALLRRSRPRSGNHQRCAYRRHERRSPNTGNVHVTSNILSAANSVQASSLLAGVSSRFPRSALRMTPTGYLIKHSSTVDTVACLPRRRADKKAIQFDWNAVQFKTT